MQKSRMKVLLPPIRALPSLRPGPEVEPVCSHCRGGTGSSGGGWDRREGAEPRHTRVHSRGPTSGLN